MRLERAIGTLLESLPGDDKGTILWSLKYQQNYTSPPSDVQQNGRMIRLPRLSPDLVLEDGVVENVRAAWKQIIGEDEHDSFMRFEAREDTIDDDEGEDEEIQH